METTKISTGDKTMESTKLNAMEDKTMETTKTDDYEDNFKKQCTGYVRSVTDELEAIINSEAYKCPECGEVFSANDAEIEDAELNDDAEFYDADDMFKCPHCDKIFERDDAEQCGIWDYFDDCYDIEYRIGGNKDYRSVCVTVACGGPNVYVDTGSGDVELYWGGTTARRAMTRDVINAIDEHFEELYKY